MPESKPICKTLVDSFTTAHEGYELIVLDQVDASLSHGFHQIRTIERHTDRNIFTLHEYWKNEKGLTHNQMTLFPRDLKKLLNMIMLNDSK